MGSNDMAKDYAKSDYAKSKAAKRNRTSTNTNKTKSKKPDQPMRPKMVIFGGFLIAGTLLGLFISGLVYLGQHKMHHKAQQQIQSPHPIKHLLHRRKRAQTTKPHYDFYAILQNKKVNEPHPSKTPEPVVKDDLKYILQVASVRNNQDAERLRSQLALLGYHVYITQSHSGKIQWHRVNVGPFKTLDDAQVKQASLKSQHINSLLLKKHLG